MMSFRFLRQSLSARIVAAGFCIVLGVATLASADLIHRYSFNDADAVKDSIGHTDGKLKGGATSGDGKLTLKNEDKTSGDDDVAYVDFDNSILPKGNSVSLVFWFSAKDAGAFSRVLDIGDQQEGAGQAFIYFTPRDSDDQSRAAITATDAASKTNQDNDRLDDDKTHMVAIVIDGGTKKLHVYVDGKEPQAAQDLGDNTLDTVRAKHTWLGRSAFDADPAMSGTINELRVYDNPLSADDVSAAFKAGPGTAPAATTQPSTNP
jgi:hypothetical protein